MYNIRCIYFRAYIYIHISYRITTYKLQWMQGILLVNAICIFPMQKTISIPAASVWAVLHRTIVVPERLMETLETEP